MSHVFLYGPYYSELKEDLMEDAMKEGMNLLITYGLKVIGVILIVGRVITNWTQRKVAYWLEPSGTVD